MSRYQAVEQRRQNLPARVGAAAFGMLVELPYLSRVMGLRAGQRVLVIGHVATRWGLDCFAGGVPLEDLIEQDFAWQEGWEYRRG